MAKYIIQGETLKAIADEVRDLVDITDEINPNEMIANMEQANADVAAQTEIIEQIRTALDGKAQSSGEDDFIGIKYSNFSGAGYNLPKTADARSLDKILKEPSGGSYAVRQVENGGCLNYAFANINTNGNGGYFVQLEEVYLPSKATNLYCTFDCCKSLTTIHGDLSNITSLTTTFRYCTRLDINAVIARMTNLNTIQNSCFAYCTQITEITLPATITLFHSGAFNGCTNIEKVVIPEGWNCSLYFHYSEKLTQESLHAMIENLADMSESTATMYFRVGSTNIAKIDEEHIAMLNTKNWNYS